MKHIEVVQYNDDWPKMFEQEAASIKQALGNNCIEIDHVGSTSVPSFVSSSRDSASSSVYDYLHVY